MPVTARARQFFRRWIIRLAWSVALIFATIVIGGALDARRRLPDLEPWHRIIPRDFRASDLTTRSTLADYLAIEESAFRVVHEQIEQRLDSTERVTANRYNPDGISHPGRLGTDWNRTQVLTPQTTIVGGALLVHGLTDSPYSFRTIAEDLRARGYYVLALRVPGHGTVPAGLTDVNWEDWLAAVRLGARHVRATIGEGKPLMLVGYSNGGALVLKYTLDVLDGSGDPPRGAHRPAVADDRRAAIRLAGARDQHARSGARRSKRRGGSTSTRNTTRSSSTHFPPTPACRRGG